MADVTLQSFVVRLKYVVDESTQKHFHENVKKSIDGLNGVRLAALGALLGVEEMVRRSTSYYSNLDYLTRSVGASAEAIGRYRAELEGANISGGEADSVLSGLAEKFRQPGLKQAAESIVGPVNNVVEFMEKAGSRYHDLLVQFHGDETAQPLVAIRTQIEGWFGAGASRIVQEHARNWDLATARLAAHNKIYKDLQISEKEATAQSTQFRQTLADVGETLQASFIKLLTTPGPDGRTPLQVITEIGEKFSKWLISKEARDTLKEIADVLLPAIEFALKHLEAIVIAFAAVWALNFAGKMVGNIRTLLGGLGELATALGLIKTEAASASTAVAAVPAGAAAAGGWRGALGRAGKLVGGAGLAFTAAELAQALYPYIGTHHPGSFADPERKENQSGWRKWVFGDPFGVGQAYKPAYQHGGIVPANLHPGEMVLPANISSGLQGFFAGGSSSFVGTLRSMQTAFVAWFSGDTAYKPIVELGDDTMERMGHGRGETPGGGGGGGGGAGGGGGGGGADSYGGRTGRTSAAYKQRAKDLYDYGVNELKLDPAHVKAMLANFTTESQLNPYASGDYGTSHGIEQLHLGRWTAAQQALGDRQHDIFAQFRYAVNEPSEREHLRQFFAAKGNEQQLTDLWQQLIERPKIKTPGSRYAQLRQVQAALDAPAAASTENVAAAASAAHDGIQAVVGDSIGVGIAKSLGMSGQDVKGGTTPRQIYERVSQHIKDYAGKVVAVTSGSNPPHQGFNQENINYVGKLVHGLREQGAKVLLAGVGVGVQDYARINAALKEVAEKEGATFGGELAGTRRRGGVVHPDDYNKVISQLMPMGSRAPRGQQAAAKPVVQNVAYHVYNNDSPSVTAKRIKHMHDQETSQLMRDGRAMVR